LAGPNESYIYPSLVSKLVYGHDAWLVGSSANPDVDLNTVRDFDVVVPFNYWKGAALLIPDNAWPNTFGGWKCISDNREIDVWPAEIGELMISDMSEWIFHPYTGTRLQKIKNV